VAHGLTRVAPRVLPDEGRVKGVLMMKLRSKMLTVAGTVLAGIGLGVLGNTVVGEAYDTDPGTALSHAPQGLKVKDNAYFNVPPKIGESDTPTADNSASVLSGSKGDAVLVTKYGNRNSGGAVWSSDKSFDMYKNQRASMWVFINADISDDTPGEGMAFVIQNDSNHAFSGTGESLGVWGVDPKSTSNTIADTAIKNSWAIEFDTHPNQTIPTGLTNIGSTVPSAFDVGDIDTSSGNPVYTASGYSPSNDNDSVTQTINANDHISSGYPALENTYIGKTLLGTKPGGFSLNMGQYYYYAQHHTGFLSDSASSNFISDGAWHHITIDYTAPTGDDSDGTMAYSFDDKNIATGGPQTNPGQNWFAKEKINLSNLKVTKENPDVYWGFTGSTGAKVGDQTTNSDTENAMVVFDQVPGQANVNATTDLTDEKTGDSADSTHPVGGNDRVKLSYKLNYENGENPWSGIKSSLNLPANIDWDQGQITYSDGSEGSTLDMSSISNNKLDVSVNDLSNTRKQAVITLEGKAKNISAQDTGSTTYFNGNNAIATATSKTFKINARSFSMSIDKDSKDINVNAQTPAKITGTFSADDTKVTAENTKVAARLTSKDGTETDIDSDKIPIVKNDDGSYSFTITIDKVPAGDTAVDVVASSSVSSGYSDEDTAKLHGGTVTFGATSGAITFKRTALTGKGAIISRDDSDGPWSLDVDSSLASGAWTLAARTNGMHSVNVPSQLLDGNLIYKDGDDVTTLNTADSPIMTSPQSTGTPTETNIASDWTSDSGILLDVNGGAVSDDYTGEIDWTLQTVPKVN